MKRKYNPLERGVSQSALGRFLQCRKKALIAIQGWIPKTTSKAFRFGGIWHRTEELLYSLPCVSKGSVPTEKDRQGIMRKVRSEYLDNIDPSTDADEIAETDKDLHTAEILLEGYVKKYPKDFTSRKWLGTEIKLEVKYNDIKLVGYIDGAYESRGKVWLQESKTKGRIMDDVLVDTLAFDLQSMMYLQLYYLQYGRVPEGLEYNIVRKPQIYQRKAESPAQFKKRLKKDILARLDFYFIRYEICIGKDEYQKWLATEFDEILREYKLWVDNNYTTTFKNTTSCMGMYGACNCLPICARGDYSQFKNINKR